MRPTPQPPDPAAPPYMPTDASPAVHTMKGPKGRFLPGNCANPGGRPKGLASAIRERVGKDGERILAMLLGVLEDEGASRRDRLDAAKILLDRGWGKSPETHVQIDATASALESAGLSPADLVAMARGEGLPAPSTEASTPAQPEE